MKMLNDKICYNYGITHSSSRLIYAPSIDDYLYYYITPTPFREFTFGLRSNDLMMLIYKVVEQLLAVMFVPCCYFITVIR